MNLLYLALVSLCVYLLVYGLFLNVKKHLKKRAIQRQQMLQSAISNAKLTQTKISESLNSYDFLSENLSDVFNKTSSFLS